MHPSPFEHVATPQTFDATKPWWPTATDKNRGQNVLGNFRGWSQYRHEFPNENIT
jgi:hypothetical protein